MNDKLYLKKFIRDDGKMLELDGQELYLADDNTLLVQADPVTTEIEYTEADGGEMIRQRLGISEQTINGLIVPKTTGYWELFGRISAFFEINHTYSLIYKRVSGEMFAIKGAWLSTRPQIVPQPFENYSQWSVTFRVGQAYWTDYAESPSGEETYAHSAVIHLLTDNMGGEVWEIPANIKDLTYMQDFAALSKAALQQVVASMVEEQVYTLKDSRDTQDYEITKLKGGFVIMRENLRLQNYKCTPEDSDVAEEFDVPASMDTNDRSLYDTPFAHIDEQYGGYYDYFTATAGTGTKELAEGEAPYSILPKGWKLMSSSEATALILAYGGNVAAATALKEKARFELNGFYENTLNYTDSQGRFNLATAVSDTQMSTLYLTKTTLEVGAAFKNNGYAIRGILRTGGG